MATFRQRKGGNFPHGFIVGNIILFIPFGFLLYMLLYDGGSQHPILPILWSVIASAALSFFVELAQLFISVRKTTPHDLIDNTFGWINRCFMCCGVCWQNIVYKSTDIVRPIEEEAVFADCCHHWIVAICGCNNTLHGVHYSVGSKMECENRQPCSICLSILLVNFSSILRVGTTHYRSIPWFLWRG